MDTIFIVVYHRFEEYKQCLDSIVNSMSSKQMMETEIKIFLNYTEKLLLVAKR